MRINKIKCDVCKKEQKNNCFEIIVRKNLVGDIEFMGKKGFDICDNCKSKLIEIEYAKSGLANSGFKNLFNYLITGDLNE